MAEQDSHVLVCGICREATVPVGLCACIRGAPDDAGDDYFEALACRYDED